MVTVETETKWMPNLDSASKLMPKCKSLGQYDPPNYFYSCLKIASPYKMNLKEISFRPRFVFIWQVHIILEKSGDFK